MLKVLGLAGSPRRGGNTELLLDRALAGAAEGGAVTEKVVLHELSIEPCRHCDGCLDTGVCVIDDDMQAIHRQLKEADRLILASPIFFMSLSAQAKLMIDRCQALWVAKYILGIRRTHSADGSRRRGLWIAVGGRKNPNLFDGARMVVRAFFATCDVEYGDEVLCPGVDAHQEILHHPDALEVSYRAGRGLVGG